MPKIKEPISKKSNQPLKKHKPIPAKDRVFKSINDKEGFMATDAGTQTPEVVAKALTQNAKKHGLLEHMFIVNKAQNRVEVSSENYEAWQARIHLAMKEQRKVRTPILFKDRVFTSTKEDDKILATDAGEQKAYILASNLNRNAKKNGFLDIFKGNGEKNRVEVSRENYDAWRKIFLNPAPKEKNKRKKSVCTKDRLFEAIEENPNRLFTNVGDQTIYDVLRKLKKDANKVGVSHEIFFANPEKSQVEVSLKDYNTWQAAHQVALKLPKKKSKHIPASEREFYLLDEDPERLATDVGVQSAADLAKTLNNSAKKCGLTDAIFVANKKEKRVEVSQRDYDDWKKASQNLILAPKKGKSTPHISPLDRKFYPIEGSEKLTTDVNGNANSLASNLNIHAKTHGFSHRLFTVNKKNNCVEVSCQDYESWRAALLKSVSRKHDEIKSKISVKDRKFVSIEENSMKLATYVDEKSIKNVTCNLNANARKKGIANRIFTANKEKNRVEIFRQDYLDWQALNLKSADQPRNSPRPTEYIFTKDRKFYLIEENTDLVATDVAEQSIIHFAARLNKKAKKNGFRANIFSANIEKNRIEVNVRDYRVWLERFVELDVGYKRLLDELNAKIPEFKKDEIHVGIAKKYLGDNFYTPMLPLENSEGILCLPHCLQFSAFISDTEPQISLKEKYSISYQNNLFDFYSSSNRLSASDKVTFIFAGRKEVAHYPEQTQGCRIVAVMTTEEHENSYLPDHIDELVLNKLSSESHGDYQDLCAINSRRIGAMMIAYGANLSECIFMDDNIKSINMAEPEQGWEQFYDMLTQHLEGKVCISIRTHQPRAPIFINNTIGSKLFMVNIQKLKTQFSHIEDVFSLFFPAHCTNWWTEDYVMQLVLVAAFDREALKIVDDKEFTLTRIKQVQNSCAKKFQKAINLLDYETDKLLSDSINIDKISQEQVNWFAFAFNNLKRIVQENVHYHQRRLQSILDIDLIKQHARANGVLFEETKEEPFIEDCHALLCNQVNTSLEDFELYPHQKDAIKSMINMEMSYGLVDMATATGKTLVQIAVSQLALNFEGARPVIIVTPTQQLVQQFYDDYIAYLKKANGKIAPCQVVKISAHMQDINVSLLRNNKSLNHKKIVMIFCLASFLKYIEENDKITPQIVFLDECHKLNLNNLNAIRGAYGKNTKIIGLTATPPQDQPCIYQYSRLRAVKDKIISPYILDKLTVPYSKKAVAHQINKLSETLQAHLHPNGKTLSQLKGVIYLPTIKDVEKVNDLLMDLSVPVYKVYTGLAKGCLSQVRQFNEETGPAIILSVGMLRIGFSDSGVQYALVLRAANQADDVKQIAGRVMRYQKDKIGYVLGFNDMNTSELTLCDENALNRCSESYLLQSGRKNDLLASSPTILNYYQSAIQAAQPAAIPKMKNITHHKQVFR